MINKLFAVVAFAVALPLSSPAHAYIKCDKKQDEKAKKKCEKNMAKTIANQRKNTNALQPSALGEEFSFLDENNPLDTDDWYVGVREIGVKQVDEMNLSVAKVSATLRLAKYTGYINKTDKAAAAKLGGILLPKLRALETEAPALLNEVETLTAESANLISDNPTQALAIPKALGSLTTNLTKAVASIPGALTAIVPIAKGAAANAVSDVTGKVGDALNTATEAIDQATDAVNSAKETVNDAKEAIGE